MDPSRKGKARVGLGAAIAEQAERVSRECGAVERQNLVVEQGETFLLSFENKRFHGAYRELRPGTADEVREVMGIGPAVVEQIKESVHCGCGKTPRLVGVADLESKDGDARGRALALARASLRAYVMGGASPSQSFKAVLDRYVQISKALLRVVFLQDIVVHDGGTLTIAGNTHVVHARSIRIHGSGRIVCKGATTINCTSLEGDYNR